MLLLLSTISFALAADSDLDGVLDKLDMCPYEDDTIDLDNNGTPDCAETMFAEFGFADQASMLAHYHTPNAAIPTFTWDVNSYVYSGGAGVGNYQANSLYYSHCLPVSAGINYTVMGQLGSFSGVSDHELVVIEYSDASCGTQSTSRVVASGTNTFGQYGWVDLVGNYTPSGFAIRSVMVYGTFDHGAGNTGAGWFENLSMHRVSISRK